MRKKLLIIVIILVLINLVIAGFLLLRKKNIYIGTRHNTQITTSTKSNFLTLHYDPNNDQILAPCLNKSDSILSVNFELTDLNTKNPPDDYKNNGIYVTIKKTDKKVTALIAINTSEYQQIKSDHKTERNYAMVTYGQMLNSLLSNVDQGTATCLTTNFQKLPKDLELVPFHLQ